MKSGIFFLTYDGYYNFTSGIGTQTKTFLKGIETYREEYSNRYGDFEINLIVPMFNETVYGYNKQDIEYANRIVHETGGNVYTCSSALDKEGSDFWTRNNWEDVSASAAASILKEAVRYTRSLVFAIDPPFLHTPKYFIERMAEENNIQSVILMYTSAYIHDEKLLEDRVAWEAEGFMLPKQHKNIKIGNVCNYLTNHFLDHYDAVRESFVTYPSSLFIKDVDFAELSRSQVLSVLNKYNIPLDKDIVFAFGRTSWVKGFDTLLKGFAEIRKNAHLVLIATPFVENGAEAYKTFIQERKLSCSLFTEFSRDLPIALCQYERCKIVVCPSRREPFSNIPFEVGLWARRKGPVVLASNIDSFREQIHEGLNGFLFEVDNESDLTRKLDNILLLSEKQLHTIRVAAYDRVVNERDFHKNFKLLLDSLWT